MIFNQYVIWCINFVVLLIPHESFALDLTIDIDSIDGIDVWDLAIEENVNYPIVPQQMQSQISQHIKTQYEYLKSKGYSIKLIRNNEVLMITIPIDSLFRTNMYNYIKKSGEESLCPLIQYLKIKEMYRMILAVHHDDTLSSESADILTYERVLYLIDWLSSKTANANDVIPYSMGNAYPITSDKSSYGREKNRRLEIFIVPGKTMLELADEKKL